ncbi:ArdC family protein [Desulfobacterales bacterium]|nr:ArdC family protein [Desulfobacterales bacterium]
MNAKVKEVLNGILDMFKSGDVPQAIAYATHPTADIPCAKWSFTNQLIMFFSGTFDARGFRQWKEAGRFVKKGSKSFHILVPCFKKVEDEESGKEGQLLTWFKSAPVFRLEDTDGEELDYQLLEVPDIPLLDRAEEWGISVNAVPGNYRFYGAYSMNAKKISLATQEEIVFFHELSHAGHEKVIGKLKCGQDPFQEIVAELSSQALCRLVGKQVQDNIGNSYRYIENYAKELKLNPYTACMKVLSETEKVLNLILKGDENEQVNTDGQMQTALA